MERRVVVVGHRADHRIQTLLQIPRPPDVTVAVCPGRYAAAAELGRGSVGFLLAEPHVHMQGRGRLLHLAVTSGWTAVLVVAGQREAVRWSRLTSWDGRVRMLDLAVTDAGNALTSLLGDPEPDGIRIQPGFLAGPEETAALLEGMPHG